MGLRITEKNLVTFLRGPPLGSQQKWPIFSEKSITMIRLSFTLSLVLRMLCAAPQINPRATSHDRSSIIATTFPPAVPPSGRKTGRHAAWKQETAAEGSSQCAGLNVLRTKIEDVSLFTFDLGKKEFSLSLQFKHREKKTGPSQKSA